MSLTDSTTAEARPTNNPQTQETHRVEGAALAPRSPTMESGGGLYSFHSETTPGVLWEQHRLPNAPQPVALEALAGDFMNHGQDGVSRSAHVFVLN